MSLLMHAPSCTYYLLLRTLKRASYRAESPPSSWDPLQTIRTVYLVGGSLTSREQ